MAKAPPPSALRFRGPQEVLAAASGVAARLQPRTSALAQAQMLVTPASRQPPPLYGPLELPAGDEEGPPDGLTIDEAIERLVRENYDLRTKYYEIPQARADVLTAGLRANPFVFATASNYPYQPYTPARPGQNGYSVSVIHPFDLNHKRRARSIAATRALRVLEAQYQDAVRLEIDRLYMAYLDVVVARETVRYAEASMAGLDEMMSRFERQREQGKIGQPEADRIAAQYYQAEIRLQQYRNDLLQAKQSLAALLALPPDAALRLELRCTLHDRAPPPPPREELYRLAIDSRPDLAAFRLGVARAQADVTLLRKERITDVFLIYSPYQWQNNAPTGGQNVTSWSIGAMGTVPLYNRNQGEIRRAQYNVSQTRVAGQALQRQVLTEVQRAELEYRSTLDTVRGIEERVLPVVRRTRDQTLRLFEGGEVSVLEYLAAQRDYNDAVLQYRDAVIRHRRSMLQLNTALGKRIMP